MRPEDELFAALERELSTCMTTVPHSRVLAAYQPRTLLGGVLLGLTGLVAMIAGVAAKSILLGLLGFGVMFAAGLLLASAITFTRN